jgi:hypothetical protein
MENNLDSKKNPCYTLLEDDHLGKGQSSLRGRIPGNGVVVKLHIADMSTVVGVNLSKSCSENLKKGEHVVCNT